MTPPSTIRWTGRKIPPNGTMLACCVIFVASSPVLVANSSRFAGVPPAEVKIPPAIRSPLARVVSAKTALSTPGPSVFARLLISELN